jgi:hypothetical protein
MGDGARMVTNMPGPQERRQVRGKMKRKAPQRLAAGHGMSPAANEEFTAMANGLGGVARAHPGWDPYEVWRTRVKKSSSVMPERERDPLH